MADSVKSPVPFICANCHRQLGVGAGIAPHHIMDGGQEMKHGEAKRESWCPVCFVMKRAPQEVMDRGHSRYAPHVHHANNVAGTMRAIKCGKCQVESLSHGPSGCIHCGEKKLIKVMAEPHYSVVLAGAKDPVKALADDKLAQAIIEAQKAS